MLFQFRSSTAKREDPSQRTYAYKLKCVICGKIQENGNSTKYRISKKGRAQSLREAAKFLGDEVYTRISDLDSDERMFSADIYYHQKCFAQYLQNYQLLKAPPESKTKQGSTKRTVFSKYYEFIKDVLARGNGVSDE